MQDYAKLKSQLDELRTDILNYNSSEAEPQDLMDHFFRVKESDPATYELLVLIYNEFHMTNKLNKKQIQDILDKAFSIKDGTVNKLIQDRPLRAKWPTKIFNLFTWHNTVRVFLLWISILITLTILYSIEPVAFSKLSDNTFKLLNKVEKIYKK